MASLLKRLDRKTYYRARVQKARALKAFRKHIAPMRDAGTTGVKLISDPCGFVFVRIPKVANTSLRDVFMVTLKEQTKAHQHRMTLEELQARYPDYFKFAFVRNPWARVVSCYLSKIQGRDIEVLAELFARYEHLYHRMPFEEFVEWLCSKEGRDEEADPHWISQHRFVCLGVTPLMDYIGYYENLQQDFEAIRTRLKLPEVALPYHMHRSQVTCADIPEESGDSDYFQRFYNPRTREMIAQRYAVDIELFGYRFEGRRASAGRGAAAAPGPRRSERSAAS